MEKSQKSCLLYPEAYMVEQDQTFFIYSSILHSFIHPVIKPLRSLYITYGPPYV
jgi:hypothetical protein